MNLSRAALEAGQEVLAAPEASLADAVNTLVRKFVGWPFTANAGAVVDDEGNRTEEFGCVVHTVPTGGDERAVGPFPADGVAAVVDMTESLDAESLEAAFGRIAQAKRLHKKPAPTVKGSTPTTTVTLGIILARRAAVPLEALGDELDRLNARVPGRERADMIVVASTGVINYGVQFPSESVTADFLPPGEGALEAYTPPIYVVMLARPTGRLSLNKMLAFLLGHLAIFSPGARLPSWAEMLEEVPKQVLTLWGYQYNLRGELVRVPAEFYNDRYMAPLPVRVEDQQGGLLGMLRFLPWQDGAAILFEAPKIPLDPLLVFVGPAALRRAGVIKLRNALISYVLPITAGDFQQMLRRIQQQSNMIVRPVQPKWTIQKAADEGSSSPLMARLMIGLLRLRDEVIEPSDREEFDKAYDFALKSLLSAREAMRELVRVWGEHERKVAAGQVVRITANAVHVDESVDRTLGREADAFLNASARAVKKGMQDVTAFLGLNIGFLFQKQAAFDAGCGALRDSDPQLAEYLMQARGGWSETLQDARNAVEHHGWILPRVQYVRTESGVVASEPQVAGKGVTAFATSMFDRAACFIEEVTLHILKRKLPGEMTITEIPLVDRPPAMPERFRLTLATGGRPPWVITYHESSFDEV
jgi:hypothetical protein